MFYFSFRTGPVGVASTLDSNRYKLHTKISIEDVDIMKRKSHGFTEMLPITS